MTINVHVQCSSEVICCTDMERYHAAGLAQCKGMKITQTKTYKMVKKSHS